MMVMMDTVNGKEDSFYRKGKKKRIGRGDLSVVVVAKKREQPGRRRRT